ncbi:unnamed protein product [Schistosoma margrebowiei]|uniref:START domain-containing protein 10 n=1 Tax=Schistosoma margrebowiei TaxID=48269 RepID=A0AA84ZJU4_9TREM|nr:unnamed protein product [Schistosoma margrebowiei]
MEIFRLGEVGPPKDDDFHRFKIFVKDETNWKRRHKKKNVEVFTRSTPHTNMKMIKVVAIFPDVSSHVIYDMLHDNDYRSSWDNTMKESTEICRITWNCSIEHFGFRAPFAFANRDFVMLRAWQPYENEYIIFNRSVFHKKVPPRSDYVRAMTFITGYVITAISPVSCQLMYLTQNDPRGDIPSWAINLATTKVAPRLVKSLHRAALCYPGWKAQNRPEFKPWRNPEQQNKSVPALCYSDILREPDFSLKKVHEKHVSKEKALKEVGLPLDTSAQVNVCVDMTEKT